LLKGKGGVKKEVMHSAGPPSMKPKGEVSLLEGGGYNGGSESPCAFARKLSRGGCGMVPPSLKKGGPIVSRHKPTAGNMPHRKRVNNTK